MSDLDDAMLQEALKAADSVGGELGRKMRTLLEKARRKATSTFAEPAALTPTSDAALHAALSDTFTVKEAGLADDPDKAAILDQSDVVMIGGRRRLRMSDECRGRILAAVRDTPRYRALLDDLCWRDDAEFDKITSDEVRLTSAWMRSFLWGTFGKFEDAPPSEMRAAVSALERLRHVPLPGVPSLEDARRHLELAELLEPLRMLVGSGPWVGERAGDRFVGREKELTRMRAYVDELESESAGEAISRARQRIVRGVRGFLTGRDVEFSRSWPRAAWVAWRPEHESNVRPAP